VLFRAIRAQTFPRGGVHLTYIRAHVKVLFAIVSLLALTARAADMLDWDPAHDRVAARVETWTVPQLLQRVSAVTGWQVLMDPSIKETVPAQFTNKNSGEALARLLGKLNFALAPETNGQSKLYVFRSSRAEATKVIAPITTASSTNKSRIANELIVTLKPGEKIEDIAKRLGAKVVGKIDGANAYRLRFDDAHAAQTAKTDLQSDPSVEETDYNYSIARPDVTQATGGAARPLGLTPRAVPDGQYTIVGLIDTAVQGKEGGISDFLLPGISVNEQSSSTAKDLTHGTSMAETILRGVAVYGNSTSVRILPVDVYGGNEMTSTFDVAAGIYKAVNSGANIINLSLGSDGNSTFLYNTIKSAYDQGVQFYAAAGNTPTTAPTYPAAYNDTVIAVSTKAPYANTGSFVDVLAPGTSYVNFNGQSYMVMGTSAATAWVSGGVAAKADAAKTTPKR
jgi:thermitase